MKREIRCLKCAEQARKLALRYPDEPIRQLEGKALGRYRCDLCNAEIVPESLCVAQSSFQDQLQLERERRVVWEKEFIHSIHPVIYP